MATDYDHQTLRVDHNTLYSLSLHLVSDLSQQETLESHNR